MGVFDGLLAFRLAESSIKDVMQRQADTSPEPENLEISLIRASDEAPLRSAAYQRELREFEQALQAQGFEVSDGIDLMESTVSGAALLADFFLKFLSSPMAPVLATAVGAWMHARLGRKERLKVGDFEAEAQTVEQVRELLDHAVQFQQRNRANII